VTPPWRALHAGSRPAIKIGRRRPRCGRLAEAERAYRGLLAERPDDAEALHLLGVLLHQSGRNDQALELIRRSLELDGSRPNVHSNLASVLGRTGRTAEALHHAREALRLAPNLPEAHNNLGGDAGRTEPAQGGRTGLPQGH